MTTDYSEEILDLVDAEDTVIGTITHEEAFDLPRDGGRYVRAAHALIVNKKGEVWIPRRIASKRIAPNGLDFSAAEHVASGETYLEAIVRGFEEELNLSVEPDMFSEIGKTYPKPGAIPYVTVDYIIYMDEAPANYSADDFSGAEWLNPNELLRRLKDGETAKENLANSIRLLIDYISV
ncbi:MAG: hydrolase [Candidatus Saccharibacteria bacterium]|nr:hydrolase [Candidatus Saccharibacteria bacterium]